MAGKQVLSPGEIISHPERYAVLITAYSYYDEIYAYLVENNFPRKSIISSIKITTDVLTQYREFPELFKKGTAIVDGGCCDGFDTIQFAKWCQGAYSKIYAFEPDPVCFPRCKTRISAEGLSNVDVLPVGLSDRRGKLKFASAQNGHGTGAFVTASSVQKNIRYEGAVEIEADTAALDDVVDTEVGLIKMDIEGAEFDALHGAKRIIQRDKPLLAICVYHLQGDMLAIMSYLHELVPEYRFWLRHSGVLHFDTILYAAV